MKAKIFLAWTPIKARQEPAAELAAPSDPNQYSEMASWLFSMKQNIRKLNPSSKMDKSKTALIVKMI